MRRFTRRDLLKTGGGILGCGLSAGCTSDGRFRRYRITNDTPPPELGATITAETVKPQTERHPITIQLTFTCEEDQPTDYTMRGRGAFPFGEERIGTRPPGSNDGTEPGRGVARLVLDRQDNGAEQIDNCWKWIATDSETNDARGAPVTLSPGESVSVDRVLLNHEQNEGCYPTGTYRFSETYWQGDAATERDDRDAIQWGFSVTITAIRPEID